MPTVYAHILYLQSFGHEPQHPEKGASMLTMQKIHTLK